MEKLTFIIEPLRNGQTEETHITASTVLCDICVVVRHIKAFSKKAQQAIIFV